MSFQPSLFDREALLPSGTKIKEFEKYIGVEVDAIDASAYYVGHKKGSVKLIEKVEVNGYDMYRVELDQAGAIGFGTTKEVHDFFESDLKITQYDFDVLCRDKKVCFVSHTESEAIVLYKKLKYFNPRFASIEIEAIPLYQDGYEFFSLDRTIYYRGYDIKRVTFFENDFYQMSKEKELGKIFHIIKNGELLTSCGKELEYLIDLQEIETEFSDVCKKCLSKINTTMY